MSGSSESRDILQVVAKFLRSLTEEDIRSIQESRSRFALVRNEDRAPAPETERTVDVDGILTKLRSASSREEGESMLNELMRRRSDLVVLARVVGLSPPKTDTVARLRERIVDATIGYRLRSDAIRRSPSDENPEE